MKKTYGFYLQSIAKVANTTHPIKVEKSIFWKDERWENKLEFECYNFHLSAKISEIGCS